MENFLLLNLLDLMLIKIMDILLSCTGLVKFFRFKIFKASDLISNLTVKFMRI